MKPPKRTLLNVGEKPGPSSSPSSYSRDIQEEVEDVEIAPRDRYNLVYICMLMAGTGFLVPWGAYIGAIDYFFYYYLVEFPTISILIPMTNLATGFFAASVNVLLAKINLHSRITFGYIVFILSLLTIPLMDIGLHNCAISTSAGFYVTLFTVGLVGLGAGGKTVNFEVMQIS